MAEHTGPVDHPQHYSRAPGPAQDRRTNKHLGNELFLASPRAVWLSLCSHMGIPAPSCTRPCLLTFRVRGRWAEVTLLIWLALRMSSSSCWNCSRPSSTSFTCKELGLANLSLRHLMTRVTWTRDLCDTSVTRISTTSWGGCGEKLYSSCSTWESVLFPGCFPSQQEDMVSWPPALRAPAAALTPLSSIRRDLTAWKILEPCRSSGASAATSRRRRSWGLQSGGSAQGLCWSLSSSSSASGVSSPGGTASSSPAGSAQGLLRALRRDLFCGQGERRGVAALCHVPRLCPPDPYPAAEATGEVLQPQVLQVLLKSSRDAVGGCHPAPAQQGNPWLSGLCPGC